MFHQLLCNDLIQSNFGYSYSAWRKCQPTWNSFELAVSLSNLWIYTCALQPKRLLFS